MNQKQLKWIAILLGVAVLLYLPRVFRSSEGAGSVTTDGGFRFEVVDAITRVDIVENASGMVTRLDRTPGGWTVDGFAADSAKITELLDVLPDLAAEELVSRNAANHGSMAVTDTSGRRIEVYSEAGGPLAFHLGVRDPTGGGYFVRLPESEMVFRLEGSAGGFLTRERDGWRPRLIASVDTAAIREILLRRGDAQTVVRRGETAWTSGDEPADSAAVSGLLGVLPGLSATGFPTDEEARDADFSAPHAVLDVFAAEERDVTGRLLVLSLHFLEDTERGDWLVRPADGAEVYRMADFTVGRLFPAALIPEPEG